MELFIFLRFPFAPNELCKALGNCPARISCFLFRAAKTWENMLASRGRRKQRGRGRKQRGWPIIRKCERHAQPQQRKSISSGKLRRMLAEKPRKTSWFQLMRRPQTICLKSFAQKPAHTNTNTRAYRKTFQFKLHKTHKHTSYLPKRTFVTFSCNGRRACCFLLLSPGAILLAPKRCAHVV